MIQTGVNCTQRDGNEQWVVLPDVIILDSASTNTCFKNKAFVNEIHQVADSEKLKLFSTGGTTYSKQQGKISILLMKVWFNDQSLANILSMNEVANIDGISTYRSLWTHRLTTQSSLTRIERVNDGLYAYNPVSVIKSNNAIINYSFVSTAKQNKNSFTRD